MATSGKTRLTLQISPELKKEFERLAKSRRRASSNEVEILMEKELKSAYEAGELDRPGESQSSSKSTISYETAILIVKANADDGQTRTQAVIETAQALGLEPDKLLEACIDAGLRPKNGNGASKKKRSIHDPPNTKPVS